MLTRDIDWFCIINGRCAHIASAGGLLPDRINDRDSLREIQHLVSTSENIYSPEEITYNEQFLSHRFAEKYEEDGILWFLESCELNTLSIRRAMWQMEHADWFKNVKGFMIGRPLNGQAGTIPTTTHIILFAVRFKLKSAFSMTIIFLNHGILNTIL